MPPRRSTNLTLATFRRQRVRVPSLFGISKEFLLGKSLGMIFWFRILRTMVRPAGSPTFKSWELSSRSTYDFPTVAAHHHALADPPLILVSITPGEKQSCLIRVCRGSSGYSRPVDAAVVGCLDFHKAVLDPLPLAFLLARFGGQPSSSTTTFLFLKYFCICIGLLHARLCYIFCPKPMYDSISIVNRLIVL